MNSRPMILRLPSGLVTPDSASRNRASASTVTSLAPGGGDEVALHLAALPGPQQPVVDEHTRQPVADGALHQRRGHRRVHAAGQPADGAAVADLVAHLLDQRVGDVGRPSTSAPMPANSCRNRLSTCWPCGVCITSGWYCTPGQPTRPVLERRHRGARAGGHHVEAVGRLGDRVAVAHPHRLGVGQIRMQLPASHFQLGAAVLTGAGARDGAAERLRHRLEAVADAEHRHAEVEHRRIELRCAVGVHAGRAAGQHDGLRILGLDLLDGRGVRDDLRVHPGLADPARDQLRVLRAEVDDEDRTGRGRRCDSTGLSLVAANTPIPPVEAPGEPLACRGDEATPCGRGPGRSRSCGAPLPLSARCPDRRCPRNSRSPLLPLLVRGHHRALAVARAADVPLQNESGTRRDARRSAVSATPSVLVTITRPTARRRLRTSRRALHPWRRHDPGFRADRGHRHRDDSPRTRRRGRLPRLPSGTRASVPGRPGRLHGRRCGGCARTPTNSASTRTASRSPGRAPAAGCPQPSRSALMTRASRCAPRRWSTRCIDDRTALRDDDTGRGRFLWTPASNRFGWTAYLGRAPRMSDAPEYAVPARREDLIRPGPGVGWGGRPATSCTTSRSPMRSG